jgi:hypothetical protein
MAMFTGRAITEQDEYTHPPTPEPHFNESMYFNFFDHRRVSGGFARIGNRPNEGYAEVTLLYYLPERQGVLFCFDRSPITSNASFDAAGMRFGVVKPLAELSVSYRGPAFLLADPLSLEDPKKALSVAQAKTIALDLVVWGLSPVFGAAGAQDSTGGKEIGGRSVEGGGGVERTPAGEHGKPEGREAEGNLEAGGRPVEGSEEVEFATAHYEQQTRSAGFIEIDGEKTDLDALGLRDHSWGPRHWQAPRSYRWLTAQFGPDLALMLTHFESPSGKKIQTGFLFRDSANIPVKQVRIDTDYTGGGRYQHRIRAAFVTEKDESCALSGEILERVPLRNRRRGQTTRICEGFTRYVLGDRTGYGISEYLDQE